MAFSQTLAITLPLLFLGSMLGAAFMSGNNVILQHEIADDIRGRVMGAYMLTWGLMPIGALPMGIAANHFGAPVAVAAGAILSTLLSLILGLSSSALRDI